MLDVSNLVLPSIYSGQPIPPGYEVRTTASFRLSGYQMAQLVGLMQGGRMPLPSDARGELTALLKAKGITWDTFELVCYATAKHGSLTAERVFQNLGPAPEDYVTRTIEARTGLPEGTPEPKAAPVKRTAISTGAKMYVNFTDPDKITQPGSNINLRMHKTLKIKGIQNGIALDDLFKVDGAMYRADIGWAVKKGFIRLE